MPYQLFGVQGLGFRLQVFRYVRWVTAFRAGLLSFGCFTPCGTVEEPQNFRAPRSLCRRNWGMALDQSSLALRQLLSWSTSVYKRFRVLGFRVSGFRV